MTFAILQPSFLCVIVIISTVLITKESRGFPLSRKKESRSLELSGQSLLFRASYEGPYLDIQMFVYLLFSTWNYRCQACVRTSSTLPPRNCPCPMDLYDVNLCPPVGNCYREANAVTYTPGIMCTAMIHCPSEYYVRFLLRTGSHLDNLRVRDIVTSQYRIECRGNQWFLVHPRFPNGQAISRLICYDTPILLNLRDISRTTQTPSICRLCPPIENTKEKSLCPPKRKCLEPSIKTVTYSPDCSNSVLECPGPELVVQLKSGLSTIVYAQDVHCDEAWIFYDGHDMHQIESMLCLSD